MDPRLIGGLVAIALVVVLFWLFGRKKPAAVTPKPLDTKPISALEQGSAGASQGRAVPAKDAVNVAKQAPQAPAPMPHVDAVPREPKIDGASNAAGAAKADDHTKATTPGGVASLAAEPKAAISPRVTGKPSAAVAGLRAGLAATRKGFMARLADLITGRKEIDPALLAEIEEVLLTSDVGPKTTQTLIDRLKARLDRKELADSDAVWAALREEATRMLTSADANAPAHTRGPLRSTKKPTVVLMVGVNGVGKTTTIGKLATKLAGDGQHLLLAAGDTFRAAAVQQLEVWGKRVGVEVVRGKDGADPASVAFEATVKAKEDAVDMLLIDTAGRLHTKTPLMDEIKKVRKSVAKALDGAPHETFLVLDATTGQNALNQAALFKEAVDLTGIVLTKLDGTAKGGIVLAIADELQVPVRYIGLGEKAEDLREFVAEDFVEALFGRADDDN